MTGRRAVSLGLGIVLSLLPNLCRAQSAAISTTIGASVRAAGMGGATSGVAWGIDPDVWTNPALLGSVEHLRFEHGSTQLVPDLADDVRFTTNRLMVGAWGVGLAFAGEPFGVGSLRLSYGEFTATDPFGNSLGTMEAYEEVSSFGIGVSLAKALGAINEAKHGSLPPISRYGDISLGWTTKNVNVVFDPFGFGPTGETNAKDLGLHVRVTPYDSFLRAKGD